MKNIKITTTLVLLLLAVSQSAFAQKMIFGKVIDANDESSMPGVNIIVKGTPLGTVTDIDGNFALRVPNDATIVVSFTGYKTIEMPVENETDFDIILEQNVKVLSEIVVEAERNLRQTVTTAMGIERDIKTLPYAVTVISGDVIRSVASPNWIEALSGRAPSVTVRTGNQGAAGANVQVFLRGSLVTLFIIDGVPYNADLSKNMSFAEIKRAEMEGESLDDTNRLLSMINPLDIESITVLPSINAAMLYGSEGYNGAIVITTKKR